MAAGVDAREFLQSLVGEEIATATGRCNTVLGLDGDNVVVATGRSPRGQLVPIEWVQNAIQRLFGEGEVEIGVASLGYRSAFVGAVLLRLPGAVLVSGTPPRVRLADDATVYRLGAAGQVNAWWVSRQAVHRWLGWYREQGLAGL